MTARRGLLRRLLRRGGGPAPAAPAAKVPSVPYTWAALAEATARVAARYHDMPDPGPSGDLDPDAIVITLAIMCAAILGCLPSGRAAALLEAMGARAAASSTEGESS